MAITALPAAPQRTDSADVFVSKSDAFVAALPKFVTDANALAANLNSLAAGGAYAIPFTFSDAGSVMGGGGGGVAVNDYTTQSTAATLYVSSTDSAGILTKLGFDDIFYTGNTSAVKGYIKLTKVGDTSKWVRLRVNSYAWNVGAASYGQFGVTVVGFSTANPFALGDMLVMQCQRTGDKGDPGTLTQVLWVRDEKPSGTTGGASITQGSQARTLNSVRINTISGASVSSNQITLPAGRYRISFSVPGAYCGAHQAFLWSVTDSTLLVHGSSENVPNASAIVSTRSVVMNSELVLSVQKVFELRHFTYSVYQNGLGVATNSGYGEVYSEVFIEKVA